MGEITALLKKQKKGDATPVISPNTYEVIDGFYCRSSYVNFLKPTADGRSSQAWSVPHVFFIKKTTTVLKDGTKKESEFSVNTKLTNLPEIIRKCRQILNDNESFFEHHQSKFSYKDCT